MKDRPPEEEFDLRARAEFSLAYDVDGIPAHLFRHTPLLARRGVQLAAAMFLAVGVAAGTFLALRPPELVRGAIEDEYYERTLRGSFIDTPTLLTHMGLGGHGPVPGHAQLMRPCEIDHRLAYHLTTFLDRGGLVTVFAFDPPVALEEGSGTWRGVYWQVVRSRGDGRPLILISEKKQALVVAHGVFARIPA